MMLHLRKGWIVMLLIGAGWLSGAAQSVQNGWMLSGLTEVIRVGTDEGGAQRLLFSLEPEAAYFPLQRLGAGARLRFTYDQVGSLSSFLTPRFRTTIFSFAPFLRYHILQPASGNIQVFAESGGGLTWRRFTVTTEDEALLTQTEWSWSAGIGFNWSPEPSWALESSLFYHYRDKEQAGNTTNRFANRQVIRLGTTLRLYLGAQEVGTSLPEPGKGDLWIGGSLGLEQALDDFQQVVLSPGMGYIFSEQLMVGLQLNFQRTGSTDLEELNWSVEPFARYYFGLNDRWQIFPNVAAGYQYSETGSEQFGDSRVDNLIWRFGTGINGFLTPAVSLEILAQYSQSNLDLDSGTTLLTRQEERLGVNVAFRYWVRTRG